jgi:hypothetical protein
MVCIVAFRSLRGSLGPVVAAWSGAVLPRNSRAPGTAPALAPQLRAKGRRGVLLDALIELQHLIFG